MSFSKIFFSKAVIQFSLRDTSDLKEIPLGFYLSLLGLDGYLCAAQLDPDGGTLTGRELTSLGPPARLRRRNRGDVSLSIASSDAELFTFVIPTKNVLLRTTSKKKITCYKSRVQHFISFNSWVGQI